MLLLFAWASDLSIQVIEDGIWTGHLPIRCQSLINALSTWYIFWVTWKLIRLRRTEFQDAKTPWHFSKSKTLIPIKGIQSALFIPTWWTNVLSYVAIWPLVIWCHQLNMGPFNINLLVTVGLNNI